MSGDTSLKSVGWHTRSATTAQTRELLKEHGGFIYDRNCYDHDIPFVDGKIVVLPYPFDTNDIRFSPEGGSIHASDFFDYVSASFRRI